MEYFEPEITKLAPKSGFDNTTEVKWDKPFVDKWQYHILGLYEWLEIQEGELAVEFSKIYELKTIILLVGDSGLTPNLLIHRLRSDVGVTLRCSFKEPWKQEQEPLFESEEKAFNSLAEYLAREYV